MLVAIFVVIFDVQNFRDILVTRYFMIMHVSEPQKCNFVYTMSSKVSASFDYEKVIDFFQIDHSAYLFLRLDMR